MLFLSGLPSVAAMAEKESSHLVLQGGGSARSPGASRRGASHGKSPKKSAGPRGERTGRSSLTASTASGSSRRSGLEVAALAEGAADGSLTARSARSEASVFGSSGMPGNLALRPTLAELGIPAGCCHSRMGGKQGEMGDHAIDAIAVASPLHMCSRSNLDPRGYQKLRDMGWVNTHAVIRRDSKQLPACSGLIGQTAGSRWFWGEGIETPRSMASSRSEGTLLKPPRSLAEDNVPAGVYNHRVAGVNGGQGDYGIDAFAVHSQLHRSVRNSFDPRSQQLLHRPNPRASVHQRPGDKHGVAGVSSGLIGQSAGARYADEDPSELGTARTAWLDLRTSGPSPAPTRPPSTAASRSRSAGGLAREVHSEAGGPPVAAATAQSGGGVRSARSNSRPPSSRPSARPSTERSSLPSGSDVGISLESGQFLAARASGWSSGKVSGRAPAGRVMGVSRASPSAAGGTAASAGAEPRTASGAAPSQGQAPATGRLSMLSIRSAMADSSRRSSARTHSSSRTAHSSLPGETNLLLPC